MITNIAHLAFDCADLEVTIDFYCNKLGLEKKFDLRDENGEIWIQYIKICHDQFVEFFPQKNMPAKAPHSYKHLSLQTDDIKGDVERLRSLGVTIDSEVSQGLDGAFQAWIKDPDGHPIELMQLFETSLQRQ